MRHMLPVRATESAQYTTRDDLKGKVVGAQAGTTYYNLLMKKGYFKEVRTYDLIADLARDLALGPFNFSIGEQAGSPSHATSCRTGIARRAV